MFEFGRLQKVFADFALENDVIASDDEGYTHGLMMGLNFQGDWGRWRLGYETRLFTEKFKEDPIVVANQGSSTRELQFGAPLVTDQEKIRFTEITDFGALFESRAKLDGTFHQLGAKIQVYTDDETFFGGRAQQSLVHGLTDSLNDYAYGDTLQVSGIVQGGFGVMIFSNDRRFYCRNLVDAELNSEMDRSFVRAQTEAGFAICRNEKNEAIFELVGSIQCTQFFEGDRYVSATADARLNFFSGDSFKAGLNGGVLIPFETPDDIYIYNDSNLLGRLFIGVTHTF